MSARVDDWIANINARHAPDADQQCERTDRSTLCHCRKRARIARGVTELPTDDLWFPPPSCPSCYADTWWDDDCWRCDRCSLAWDSRGSGSSAHWTDDYGTLPATRAEADR